jgi:hypothetical protein
MGVDGVSAVGDGATQAARYSISTSRPLIILIRFIGTPGFCLIYFSHTKTQRHKV